MDEVYKVISKPAFYAIIGILGIAIIYSISPKIGVLLAITIILAGGANLYASGMIKPPVTK